MKLCELLKESQGINQALVYSLALFDVTVSKTLPRRKVAYPIKSIISRLMMPQVGFLTGRP